MVIWGLQSWTDAPFRFENLRFLPLSRSGCCSARSIRQAGFSRAQRSLVIEWFAAALTHLWRFPAQFNLASLINIALLASCNGRWMLIELLPGSYRGRIKCFFVFLRNFFCVSCAALRWICLLHVADVWCVLFNLVCLLLSLSVPRGVIQNGARVRSQALFPVIRPLPVSPVGSRTSAIRLVNLATVALQRVINVSEGCTNTFPRRRTHPHLHAKAQSTHRSEIFHW